MVFLEKSVLKKSYARPKNLPDNARQPAHLGSLSRGIAWVGRAGGTRRRCAADTSGARLKKARLRGPRGRQACRTRATRGSTWRSLRTSRQELADVGALLRRRKRGPGSKKAAAERREARRSASSAGHLRRS